MKISPVIFLLLASCFHITYAQSPQIASITDFETVNRHVTVDKTGDKNIVHLDAAAGDGIAWVKNISFSEGTIEFDVKGKDVLQQSFVGMAFHGINDSSFEAVYFRPFNFQATEEIRKSHSVQYIFMPKYDWSYLRETYPGKYENRLHQPVQPADWFHVKIIVDNKNIKAFVNGDSSPSLEVQSLSDNKPGKIGFWVGNNSDGGFSNLVIKNK